MSPGWERTKLSEKQSAIALKICIVEHPCILNSPRRITAQAWKQLQDCDGSTLGQQSLPWLHQGSIDHFGKKGLLHFSVWPWTSPAPELRAKLHQWTLTYRVTLAHHLPCLPLARVRKLRADIPSLPCPSSFTPREWVAAPLCLLMALFTLCPLIMCLSPQLTVSFLRVGTLLVSSW